MKFYLISPLFGLNFFEPMMVERQTVELHNQVA